MPRAHRGYRAECYCCLTCGEPDGFHADVDAVEVEVCGAVVVPGRRNLAARFCELELGHWYRAHVTVVRRGGG